LILVALLQVRKAVVFCLVDMYITLGDWLMPHLAPLSQSQLKLVTIYINRNHPPKSPEAAAITN
jgi:CLIP-associating protein 1/2